MNARDDKWFFDMLYRGYAAEHFISSQLFDRSYEVFRLPADFGLDLVVTDTFRTAQGGNSDKASFPFSLQVKSRRLKPADIQNGPNDRPQATFDYLLKQAEVSHIQKDSKSAFAFVFYWPIQPPHVFKPLFFLVPSISVAELLKKNYFRPAADGFTFTVRYRSMPLFTRESFLDELSRDLPAIAAYKQRIGRLLPDRFLRNWRAETYLQFARPCKNQKDPNVLKFSSVWNVPTNFSDFPRFTPIGGLS